MSHTLARSLTLGVLATLAVAGAAHADQCKAIPDNGPMPAYLAPGSTFRGAVKVVIDGDSMCVARGAGPENLVEVRLADFHAPEFSQPGGPAAQKKLAALVLGREVVCKAGSRTHDRVAAQCTLNGRAIGSLMRQAGVTEGGNGTRRAAPVARPVQPQPFAGSPGWSYRNCREAREAGAAPLYRGQPGYGAHMDGDGDGIACEPYRGRR
ncbi:excalibur calcium-binding domain-containing protein [Phenylobacterium sp. J426]|uniref:thermonuclease family protein n=1 Tax=Phenylobacterium sp. J426 TaxID=2898439 RepID=UPI0021509D56|nr:excalibur calcium-binding domain-containing protein [Phenylobacterium sp. J426]MCR5875690.1 excalibur calcium-binding domain-containing protein [Phenylobacterium sp. J426]